VIKYWSAEGVLTLSGAAYFPQSSFALKWFCDCCWMHGWLAVS